MTDQLSPEWQRLCATQLPIPLLYVDDDTDFVEEVKTALKPLGYKITSLPTAKDALEYQDQTPVFLVIINHDLPDKQGIDLVKEFLKKDPTLQTVFITSVETEHQAAEALRAGVTCYINKDPKNTFLEVLPAILERTLLRAETNRRHQELEDEVRQSQQRLSQAVTLAELGFWEWDETRNTALYYSPELLKIYEMSASDIEMGDWTANKDLKHLHPEDYENYRYQSHFNDGTTNRFDVEFRVIKEDRRIAHLREIGQAIRDKNNKIIRSYGTVQDITRSKTTEKSLQLALNEAEKANRTKASFLATMSHELRTPLNAILGFSEILVGQYFGPLGSEKYKAYAQDIHNSGSNLLSLISNILEMSSAETGQLQLNKENLQLCTVIKDCYGAIAPSFDEAGIETHLQVIENFPPINADPRALRQVFLNLLTNAAKFTPRNGKVDIELKERKIAESGSDLSSRQAHITIRDNGIGINKNSLKRLLQPFTRLNSDPHLSQEGTGLGLAIVKSLTEAHDGSMEIDSQPGIGTTVHLYLPLEVA